MATSPEIIHGTTPARDLFSFVPAEARRRHSLLAVGGSFSTGVSRGACITYGLRSVGNLWTMVHKPGQPGNVFLTIFF